ncbi:juvenile hormone acid O-methyltransferase-like [Phlebotomus argentipes]|uniref:juvenile hormone acid O-methyltransferase-like n=1 Tax=Phlebotomus argentipes TaxID=94469 RepID=UPI002892A2BA|nr:juvenile hormone acid O-methyltransferase-like [Phlebotomus argentipes]
MSTKFDPNFYKSNIELRVKLVQRCLNKVSHLLQWQPKGGDSVLDIGCGVGDITRECFYPLLPANYSRLVCSDISESMLHGARKTFHGIDRVNFTQININEPLSDAKKVELKTFNHIFSSFCLTYVKNQKQAFQNVFDLLEMGGDIMITIQAITPSIECLFRMAEQKKWKNKLSNIRETFVYSYREDSNPKETIESLLRCLGFTQVVVELEESFETYKTEEYLKDFMKGLPFGSEVSEMESEEFFRDLVNIAISMNLIEEHLKGSPPLEGNVRKLIHIYAMKPNK